MHCTRILINGFTITAYGIQPYLWLVSVILKNVLAMSKNGFVWKHTEKNFKSFIYFITGITKWLMRSTWIGTISCLSQKVSFWKTGSLEDYIIIIFIFQNELSFSSCWNIILLLTLSNCWVKDHVDFNFLLRL